MVLNLFEYFAFGPRHTYVHNTYSSFRCLLLQPSAETERKIFEFEQNEQVDFRAERVSSKIFGIQFSSRASSSKNFSSGQNFRAKPERARAIFRAQISSIFCQIEQAKIFFSSTPQILSPFYYISVHLHTYKSKALRNSIYLMVYNSFYKVQNVER